MVTILQKMNLTALAVVRHAYVFCNQLVYKSASMIVFIMATFAYIRKNMSLRQEINNSRWDPDYIRTGDIH